jgi:ketosteroid isomerase-like protein
MSQADIETLRAAYEAANRGDWDSALRGMHPDFEWETADQVPLAGTYRGPEEVRQFFEDQRKAFEEVLFEPEQFLERDDRIVVFALGRFRPRGSGATVEIRIAHLWTMRDGKAARCKAFPVRQDALEAVGLSEQDAHADS